MRRIKAQSTADHAKVVARGPTQVAGATLVAVARPHLLLAVAWRHAQDGFTYYYIWIPQTVLVEP